MDLRRAEIIYDDYSSKSSEKPYRKGSAFRDIRLNFPAFLAFVGTDMYGTKFENNGFLDRCYAREVSVRKIISHDKSSTDTWRLREYNFGISTGEILKKKKRTFDFELLDHELYLFQDFEVIYVTNTSSSTIKVEEIGHDKTNKEYRRLFDEGYKALTQMR